MTQLLFVCHANMLRSVSAEFLARWLTAYDAPAGSPTGPAAEAPWTFASAGIRALPRHLADRDAAEALRARGIDPGAHRARQLTARMLQEATLTLTFDSDQRAWALRESPRSARSVVTMRRAARLLGANHAETAAADWQSLLIGADPYRAVDDFADPVGTGVHSVAEAVDEIEALLRVILPALGAPVVR